MTDLAKAKEAERGTAELGKAHMEQQDEMLRLQAENQKLGLYRETSSSQEKVIAKLERVLESSLGEVEQAQQAQLECERLRTQVVRLQEQCAALAAKASRVQAVADGSDPQALAAKDREVERLKVKIEELEVQQATGP